MIRWSQVSAFGDEAASGLDDQLACLRREEIQWLEFRSAGGISVVAMEDDELRAVRRRLDAAGVRVSAIGSPVGKVALTDDWRVTEEQLERSLAAAKILQTRLIRMFSFYVDNPEEPAVFQEVVDRLGRMSAIAATEGVVLVHENEKGIFGDTPQRCRAILDAVGSASLAACFDVANFVQVGVSDVPAAWTLLAPHVRHVHVKDAIADGSVRPAGEGAGDWPFIAGRLDDAGYGGFLTIEPHLDGVVPGDGCARLGVAAAALRQVLGLPAPIAVQ